MNLQTQPVQGVLTWDQAFRGMLPALRQQSVRVGAYTEAIFRRACADGFARKTPGAAQIHEKNAELAYKCGLYHQLGKTMLPQSYQIEQSDFSAQDKKIFRRYPLLGRRLVAQLQQRSVQPGYFPAKDQPEPPTRNLAWLMIRESCAMHMERADGSGYPLGLRGDEITPIGQIVGLAHELDTLACGIRSEQPFEDAMKLLEAQSGKQFSEELIGVLKNARPACKKVFQQYIQYSRIIPKVITLVDQRANRPMGLKFYPLAKTAQGAAAAWRAEPWFVGMVEDEPTKLTNLAETLPMLQRTGLTPDICKYFLYEAADTLLRLAACRIDTPGILMELPMEYYLASGTPFQLEELAKNQPIPMEKLLLTVPQKELLALEPMQMELLQRVQRSGVSLIVTGFDPANLANANVAALQPRGFMIDPALYMNKQTAMDIARLNRAGYLTMGTADESPAAAWLEGCSIGLMGGGAFGAALTQDELIVQVLEQSEGQ